jgi:hypothetical protein
VDYRRSIVTSANLYTPFAQEFKMSVISQCLTFLTNLGFYMPIIRICIAEIAFESVHIIERKLRLSEPFNALHDVQQQPALRFQITLSAKKQRVLPSVQDIRLRFDYSVLYDRNSSCVRYSSKQHSTSNPASTSSSWRKWLPFFYHSDCDKVLAHNDQVCHDEASDIVVEKKIFWD